MPRDHSFASPTLGAHLLRGATGFGLLLLALATRPTIGWLAVFPAALGVIALRGCPMCWTIGLVQTLSRQRFRRECTSAGCSFVDARRAVPSSP